MGKADKVALLRRADAPPAPREALSARSTRTIGTAAARSWSPTQRASSLATTRSACVSVPVVANGDTGMQTGGEAVGSTMGFEMFDRYDVEELARSAAERALSS